MDMDAMGRLAGAPEAPVFAELAEAGFAVERIGELRRFPDYRAAIPILLRWLPRVEDPYLKWAIVCALGVKWARPAAAPALVEEFRQAPEWPCGYKWAIGAALSVVADESMWEDLVPLVCNPRHGHARQMLVAAIGCMQQPRAVDVLLALLNDEDVEIVEGALRALGRRRVTRERARLALLLTHEDRRIRQAARLALGRIDRARARMVDLDHLAHRAHGGSDGQARAARYGARAIGYGAAR